MLANEPAGDGLRLGHGLGRTAATRDEPHIDFAGARAVAQLQPGIGEVPEVRGHSFLDA